ncbi:MAG TPA: CBS domain-containing protein [Candidatus Xenobia bacterium]
MSHVPGVEVIIGHTHADFDALASMVAASKLYPQARMMLTGAVDQAVKEFLALYRHAFPIEPSKGVRALNIQRLVIVDTRVPSRLGEFRDFVSNPQVEVIIFDHHPATAESVVGDEDHACLYGATTTMLVGLLRDRGIRITPLEATLFCLGIYEETGCLLFPDTTPEDIECAAWCLRQGAMLTVVSRFMRRPLSDDQHALLNALLTNARTHTIQGYRVLTAHAEIDHYVDELAVLTSRLLDIGLPDAVFTAVRMRDRVYVVGRSQEQTVNVAQAVSFLGGGGHPTAASATLRGAQAEAVEAEVVARLQAELQPACRARDIMSSPAVVMTEAEATVGAAWEKAVRFGFSGYPVLEQGRLRGVVTRRDLEKAVSHGMQASPLRTIVSAPAITIEPDMPLPDIQRVLLERDVGRAPVVDHHQLLGIVSRSDLLRVFHGVGPERPSPQSEAVERLRALPAAVQQLLEGAGDVGDEGRYPTFVVGGFVRDLLLGVENLDIDLVVEGDGIQFARTLARRLGGRVKSHQKFGTAVITLPDDTRVDVATARIEFYTRPAALPEVTASPLKQDLYRRDFTINALAVRLNRGPFGTLYDFFSARRDLREGVVRVLHNLSFVDDPTRIFRAIRFEQRYHFRMDSHTETLLRQAVEGDIFQHLSNERIRDEIIEILSEARPLPAVRRMQELKVLRLIHPRIHLNSKLVAIMEEITAVLVQYGSVLPGLDRWLIYFMGLVSQIPAEAIADIARRYRIPQVQQSKLGLDKTSVTHVLRTLYPPELRPSGVYRVLKPLSTEAVVYLLARTRLQPVRQKVADYLRQGRTVTPLVTGQDLLRWGYPEGPEMGRLLQAVLGAQIDGEIGTVEEAHLWLGHRNPAPAENR